MKVRNVKLSAAVILLGASLLAPSAFAATPYDMEYSGGELLDDSNVTIDPGLIDSLTPLMTDINAATFSDSGHWKDAWFADGYYDDEQGDYVRVCNATRYLEYGGEFDNDNGNIYFTVSNNDYSVRVQIDDIKTSIPWVNEGNKGGVAFNPLVGEMFMEAGGMLYSDEQCEDHIRLAGPDGNGEVYVQMNLKLSDSENKPFHSDELFLKVDMNLYRHSFMVLNSDNLLMKRNMYAASVEELQPSWYKNMFVSDTNYIYNDEDPQNENSILNTDIFVNVGRSAQDGGIDVVHGFSYSLPYPTTLFYAKEYLVSYISDGNGEITGIADEEIFSGNNPTGSASTPKEGYRVEYWTADKNVILEDGTEVGAGEHLTAEQVKEVRVNSDLTFTAHHGEIPAPDPDPEPEPEPEPEPDPEPDPEPKPEPEPEPEVELEKEEEPEIPVPNTGSPDTGAYTNDAGFITLGLAGSIVAGITLALVGLAIKSKRN